MDRIIKADIYRWIGTNKFGIKEFLHLMLIPQFKFMYFKRKCQKYRNRYKTIFILFTLLYKHYKIKYGIDLPAKVQMGEGIIIEHIGGIVINPDVIFGNNINIYNGVTIGIEKRGRRIGIPTIGNEVWIGANSTIVGNILIGDDVLIAPGTYINFDVPNHSIVMGNPGKVVSRENATEAYVENCVY